MPETTVHLLLFEIGIELQELQSFNFVVVRTLSIIALLFVKGIVNTVYGS